MKKIYKLLLAIVCFLLSFTLSSQQTRHIKLNDISVVEESENDDQENDSDILENEYPDNYDDIICAYGPGPATDEGCSITLID